MCRGPEVGTEMVRPLNYRTNDLDPDTYDPHEDGPLSDPARYMLFVATRRRTGGGVDHPRTVWTS